VRVVAAQGGESLKDVAKTLWGTENRAWDLALLNGIRDEDRPLRAGEKVKVIYDPFEETPLQLQLDLSLTTP
jgi:predicted Zn-dependent protease